MLTKRQLIFAFLSVVSAGMITPGPAEAQDATIGTLTIKSVWARMPSGSANATAIYFTIVNGGAADKLVSAATEVAAKTNLHKSKMSGSMMSMGAVPSVEVPAGATVAFAPGGLHVMVSGLTRPLKSGDRFPLTLAFEKAGSVTVSVAITALGAMDPGGAKSPMHGM